MAGSYQGGVPDPADTSGPSDSGVASFGSYDDLNQYGIPEKIKDFKVTWERRPSIKKPLGKATDAKTGKEVEGIWSDASGVSTGFTEIPNNLELTYAESIEALYQMDPERIGDLQTRLAAGGWFGANPNFVPKTAENKTRTVWDNVLKVAIRSGKTPDEIIQESIDAEGGLEEGLKKRGMTPGSNDKPKSVLVTHPDDIRAVAKRVSTATLGRGWNNEQLDKFVQAYQAMDRASGEAEGTRASAPSLEAAAEAAARKGNPLQAQANDANNIMNMVMTAFDNLGGGSSSGNVR